MSNTGSWSVKGIDDRARAAAKEQARRKGVTLGDYINDMLLQGHSEAGPRDLQSRLQSELGEPSALDRLSRKLEAVEARSTLAITGIDQSVLGLIARLENAEASTSAVASEVDGMIDDLRETQDTLRDKIAALEADDTGHRNLESMRSLEEALGKLANHVFEEAKLTQDETAAIKGRVEAGFNDLTERVEGMEVRVDRTLAEAAERIERSVESAELRTEGTVKHVSERLSAIETSVATRLEKVGDMGGRMDAVESDVSGALTSMENTLQRIQDRLNRAESTTDAALMGLEQSFLSLDERLSKVAEDANPEKIQSLRLAFEERFEALAADLRSSVDVARSELANQIEAAASGDNPELMGRIETTIETLKQRLVTGEERSSRAVEAISQQMSRLSDGLDQRMQAVEENEAHLLDKVSEHITSVADTFEKRIDESESRSAAAIEQVGEQVATAVNRLQVKQEAAIGTLKEEVAAAAKRSDARLSSALSNVSERLREIQKQTVEHVSPVQKAMASLAARLEAVEDFTNPPGSQPTQTSAFTSKSPAPVTLEPMPDIPFGDPEGEEPGPAVQDFMSSLQPFDEGDEDGLDEEEAHYESGASAFAQDDDEGDFDSPFEAEADPDYQPSASQEFVAELPLDDGDDPFAGFEDWDQVDSEMRENDVFSTEMSEPEPQIPGANSETSIPLPVDKEATDYLSRARAAAVAASQEQNNKSKRKKDKPQKTKAEAAKSKKAKAEKPLPGDRAHAKGGDRGQNPRNGSSKLPIIAAASVLAVAAAGGGAYISLRGKQAPPAPASIATVTPTPRTALAAAEADRVDAPVETADLEADLFDETDIPAATPAASLNALRPVDRAPASVSEAPVSEAPVTDASVSTKPLPRIPEALSLARAAEEGNAVAQYLFGEQKLDARDYQQGPKLIQQAASQGLPAAQYRLAKLYEEGLGVPRDLGAARDWTERAANGGNVKAMHDLAVYYADGEGGAQSYAGAAKWFRQAADFGLVDSQYNLAVLHEEGLGVSPSLEEALFWFEVAFQKGDAAAKAEIDRLRREVPLTVAQSVSQRAASWTAQTPVAASNGTFGTQSWGNGGRAQVRAMQEVLNGLGYEAGLPDGIAGAGTRTAIRAFQADMALPTTGEIDDALVLRLNEAAKARDN